MAFNTYLTLSVISVIRIINNWYQIGNLIDCTVGNVYSTRVNSNFSPKQNLIQNMHFILWIVDPTHKWKKSKCNSSLKVKCYREEKWCVVVLSGHDKCYQLPSVFIQFSHFMKQHIITYKTKDAVWQETVTF